ncbi:MAG: S8 family serine peptidase [Coleofasciculus sp. A1-SPW-01]|nr:S8 family serine peptidase [Coleofasciculus chthonoplastes]
MHILNFFSKKRPSAKGFQPQSTQAKVQRETFVLEPILTPSGLVDSMDDTPDIAGVELSSDPLDQVPIPEIDDILPDSILDNSIPDEELEEIPFIAEEVSEIEKPLNVVTLENPNPTFESGVFTVGDSGQVQVDFLFDGGSYKGELAIFSLEGMDQFEPGSEDFILEASSRALSNSELGHIVISDQTEGAKFSGQLGESDQNAGDYLGAKSFVMRPGDKFGFMLVPNGQVQQVFDNPEIEGVVRPLFSLATANPDDAFHVGQIADVTGDGNTFVMEDWRVDTGSDLDYNDLIFQVRGATGEAVDLDDVIEGDDWRESKLGRDLINYTEESVFEVELDNLQTELFEEIDNGLDQFDQIEKTEIDSFPEKLDLALESPENILDNALAKLPEDVNVAEEKLTTILEQEITGLPDELKRTFEDFSDILPQDLENALSNFETTLDGKLAELSEVYPQELDELIQIPEELNQGIDQLKGDLDELKMAIADEVSELPNDISTAFQELEDLFAEVKTDIATEVDTQELRSLMDDLLVEVAADSEEDETILGSLNFIGTENPLEPTESNGFEFPSHNQPLIGIIDTGLGSNNPDIDYSRIILGRDFIDGDNNPLLQKNEGDEHGTHILGLIGATQDNNIGINGVNDNAPLWVGRAVGSGQWADSLIEFVDATKASNQPNAVVNLSFDLIKTNPDGSETTRFELTNYERAAIEYARQNGVLLVVAAGNQGGSISALGQASREFDNIITVGATDLLESQIEEIVNTELIDDIERASYSNYGESLDILASGGSDESPAISTVKNGFGIMAGTSVATAKVTGAVSQIWAANPDLSYQQVIEILKSTAIDLNTSGCDAETGSGLLDLTAAVSLAAVTTPNRLEQEPVPYTPSNPNSPDAQLTSERAAGWGWFKRAFKKVGKAIKKGVNKVVSGVKKVVNKVTSGIKKGISTIWGGIKKLGKQIGSRLLSPISKFLGKFKIFSQIGNLIKKIVRPIWNGIKWVSRQLWYKLQGIYHRVGHWINQLPKRVARVVQGLWEAVKSFKPWAVSWWKSLGKAKTWEEFGKWLGRNLIYVGELLGFREIYDTVIEFYYFNSRPLKPQEINWARSVFGGSIDYSVVRLETNSRGTSKGANATTKGNFIAFPKEIVTDDIFVHEMVHVWQYQSNSVDFSKGGDYLYGGSSKLRQLKNNGKGLLDSWFGRERQAEMVQDYFLLRNGKPTQPNRGYTTSPADLPLYVYFVRETSTLTEAQLLGVGYGSRAPHLFQEAYNKIDGFSQEIYPKNPAKGAYRSGNSWIQDFADQSGKTMYLVLEDGANQAYWSQNPINNTKLVDLSGQYLNVNPEPLKAGDYFDVDFRIQNTEVNSSGDFDVKFYLSKNTDISGLSPHDRYLGSYSINNVVGNSSTSTLTKRLRLPSLGDSYWSGDDTYYIGMIVDANKEVAETNESNNRNTGKLDDYDDVRINNTKGATVTVKVNRVKGDFDPLSVGGSDFYSRISIGSNQWRSPTNNNDNDYSPSNWSYSRYINGTTVPIAIQLYDQDNFFFLFNPDDHIDIDPKSGNRDINITYDLRTGRVSGDLTGYKGRSLYSRGGGDSDQGEIWFTVNQS